MKDQRKQKIKRLKTQIKWTQRQVKNLLTSLNVEKEAELTEEQREENRKKFKDTLSLKKVTIENTEEELAKVIANKNSSSFFEFLPTPPNRKMKRRARKLRRL